MHDRATPVKQFRLSNFFFLLFEKCINANHIDEKRKKEKKKIFPDVQEIIYIIIKLCQDGYF